MHESSASLADTFIFIDVYHHCCISFRSFLQATLVRTLRQIVAQTGGARRVSAIELALVDTRPFEYLVDEQTIEYYNPEASL